MSNKGWAVFTCILVAYIFADLSYNDGAHSIFLLKKLSDLIEWLAFWR